MRKICFHPSFQTYHNRISLQTQILMDFSFFFFLLKAFVFAATRSGRYGCTSGPISMYEQSAMGSETLAVMDRVTKQIVTIFSKT